MRFAVGVPNVREYGDPNLLLELGVLAEQAGWDGFFVWDHLVYRELGDPVSDPWIAVTAVAARTSNVRLGVMVCALPRRRPWVVARQAAALDIVSNGRLVFGAGLGSLGELEYAAFGEEPDDRARADRLDEGLQILAGLWSGSPFSFRGRHYRVDRTVFLPVPVQRPIPVWIAGRWPAKRPLRRAARCQGLFATHREVGLGGTMSLEQLDEVVRYTLTMRADHGPFDFVTEGASNGSTKADVDRVAEYGEIGLTWWVERLNWARGTVDEMRSRIKRGPPR
jgi:alkanesulfonate monooxygenase SsuD/methylene tetrahydromethanopterin reductase-like flavin-dependent oxidoreductase (luciferase family)